MRGGSLQKRPANPGVFDSLWIRSRTHLRVQPDQRSRGTGSRNRPHDAGGEIPGEVKAQESTGPRIGQTPKRRYGFPEGAIPCRRLSLLVLRIPELEPTTDHSTRVAVVEPPPGPSFGFGRTRTGPDGNVGSGGASRARSERIGVRALPSTRLDTELQRVAARPFNSVYVGSHDAPRRVAPPQAPWRSSGARVGQPDRVHPGTRQLVR